MRSVSRGFRRSVVFFVLFSVLVAQGAAASGRGADAGFREHFERVKRFVVTIFSRFGWPPGAPGADTTILGRLSPPPGQPVDDDTTLKTAGGSATRAPE